MDFIKKKKMLGYLGTYSVYLCDIFKDFSLLITFLIDSGTCLLEEGGKTFHCDSSARFECLFRTCPLSDIYFSLIM